MQNMPSYFELLKKDEWKEKREVILRRDGYYCTDCNKSSSYTYFDRAIYFEKDRKVNLNHVIPAQIPLEDFKKSFDIELINICKEPKTSLLYGVCLNYVVFGIDNSLDLNTINKKELTINYYNIGQLSGSFLPIIMHKKSVEKVFIPIPLTCAVNHRPMLQVHHKRYILGKLPWQYSNSDLITLCNYCHQKLHDSNVVPVLKETKSGYEEVNLMACSRCNGSGYMPQYSHVKSGVCFKCNGKRFVEDLYS